MRARDRFDAGAATAFLREHLADRTIAVQSLSGGNWSDAYAFRHDGADLVARFGRQPDDYRKDRRAAAWTAPDLPVPVVHDVGPVGHGGWWFAISTRAFGAPLESVTPAAWSALVPRVVDLIARCASLPHDQAQGVGRWDPDGTAPQASWREFLLVVAHDGPEHRIAGWRTALAARPDAQAAFSVGLTALDELSLGLEPPVGVVHADLINANVLVAGDRITAVLDWGSAMYGDPLHDVAWIDVWSPWHPNLSAPALLDAVVADGRLTAGGDVERRLAACRLHIALGHLAYHAWNGDDEWLDQLAALTLSFVA